MGTPHAICYWVSLHRLVEIGKSSGFGDVLERCFDELAKHFWRASFEEFGIAISNRDFTS